MFNLILIANLHKIKRLSWLANIEYFIDQFFASYFTNVDLNISFGCTVVPLYATVFNVFIFVYCSLHVLQILSVGIYCYLLIQNISLLFLLL